MGDLISQNRRYAVTTVLFIVSFLLSLFIFSKRTLQPSVAVYQQFSPLIKSQIQSSDPPLPPPPPQLLQQPLESSTHQLSPSNVSQADPPLPTPPPPPPPQPKLQLQLQQQPLKSSTQQLSPSNVSQADELVSSSNEPSVDDKQYPPLHAVDNVEEKKQICDIYTGTWVKDQDYPIYKPGSCPYVDEAFDCQSNGRQDSEYLRWRWKPDGCDLPRFNATDFLERLRGKKLLLVGDSMNRNQFESMLCLLREGLANKSKMYEINGNKITKGRGRFVFKFEDYNCTVEFLRSHFLVREGVRINGQGNSNPTLSIDRIDKSSGRWKRADILIFNTGHWWVHGKISRGINYFREGDNVYPKFDSVEAYRRAMKTWAKWIDRNVNQSKQLVFYRGYSSAHFRGGDWNSGGSCNGETEPILSGPFLQTYPSKMKIVEEVIREMKVPVILLNVTRLTNFRKDGHPSVYGKSLTDGRKRSTRRQDCSHWCLPGVPDAWNELIYAILLFNKQV